MAQGVKRAAIYIRVSTDQQAKEGESIPAQRARLAEWAKANGYVVVAEYCDAGQSARAADRPEFIHMLQDARQSPRQFDAILVWKWDRFARNVDDATIYKGLLRRQIGLDLVAVGDPQTQGAVGVLLERILDVVAEFQSLITAEHVKNTMTYLAKDGRWLGKVPFGYALDDTGKLIIQEEEAAAVRWAFEQVWRQLGSVYSLAEEYAVGLRFPATSRRGYKWSPQAIRQILRNPVYLGRVIWNRRFMTIQAVNGVSKKRIGYRDEDDWVVVEEAHPAIVKAAMYDEVQRILNERGARNPRTPRGDYLFRGLVKCARCGHALTYYAPDNGTRPRLVCSQYFRIPSVACRPMNYVTPGELETVILDMLSRLADGGLLPELEIVTTTPQPRTGAERAAETVRERLRRLMEAYEAGAITLDEFKERRSLLDRELLRLTVSLERDRSADKSSVVEALRERASQVLALFRREDASLTQRHMGLSSMIHQITVDRDGDGIRVIWRIPTELILDSAPTEAHHD